MNMLMISNMAKTIIGTAIVALIVCIAIALIIISMIKDKKKGKSVTCGMDCSKCPKGCKGMHT